MGSTLKDHELPIEPDGDGFEATPAGKDDKAVGRVRKGTRRVVTSTGETVHIIGEADEDIDAFVDDLLGPDPNDLQDLSKPKPKADPNFN